MGQRIGRLTAPFMGWLFLAGALSSGLDRFPNFPQADFVSGGGSIIQTGNVPQDRDDTGPDFGPDGLKGLTGEQRKKLLSGELLVFSSHEERPGGQTVISAALIFEVPIASAWSVLSATERQKDYVEEIEDLRLVEQGVDHNRMFFLVKIMGREVRYTVIHRFEPEVFYFWWELDRSRPHDVKELFGYWRLYRIDDGRTLARYGSRVVPDFPVPGFIRNWLAKSNVRSSLLKVKKYVEQVAGKCEMEKVAER
ncbi:MAG: hypothetical protein QME85_07135 [Candidatus Saccharicenans sp.]|nr:hypothetical protein [Candidatus Saccharicenans sp.]